MARKDLSEFLLESRKMLHQGVSWLLQLTQLHNFTSARNLHNTVHGGLLRPAIEPFLQAISSLGCLHVYYGGNRMTHSNHFLNRILNGSNVTKLKAYSQLEFEIPMSRVNRTVIRQWTMELTVYMGCSLHEHEANQC